MNVYFHRGCRRNILVFEWRFELKHWIGTVLLAACVVCYLALPVAAADHPLLLVVDREENILFFVNAETYETVATLRTGVQAQEVVLSPDGKTAFVSNFNDHRNTIMLVDVVEMTKIKDINPTPYYKPHGMAVTRDGKKLFVTCEASRAVVEMDIDSGQLLRAFDTAEKLTHMLALSPDEKTIYTTNSASGTVTIIDVGMGRRVGSLRSGGGCEGLAISPDGSEVWAANRRTDTITIIDTETNTAKDTIQCRGYPYRIKFTPDGERALVSCPSLNFVHVFDAKSRESIDVVRTNQAPVGIDITPDGKTAFSANVGKPSITVIDLEKLAEVTSFPIGTYPFAVKYVPATGHR
jgi:YVTN family beta-propeller protein